MGQPKRIQHEASIEIDVLQFLNSLPNTFAFKVETTGIYSKTLKTHLKRSRYSISGLPDIFGFRGEKFFMIELKHKSGVSITQRAFIKKARSHGQFVDVCRSVDEVRDFLRKVDENDRLVWNYEPR